MQIFVIHGGDSFASYEEYIEHLKNWQIDINRLRGGRDWKGTLQEQLGSQYDVFTPSMPNARNAKYLEWKIWFEKFIPFMEDNVVLVGHSLGGSFLAKYLAEADFPKRIRATFLVAAPYDEAENPTLARELHNFAAPQNLEKLAKKSDQIFLYHSKDDPVVTFSELSKYQKALPKAKSFIFEDRGHFNQESFPELAQQIKALSGL